jgi:hypothetical protein
VVLGGQVLPAAGVVGPVSQPGGREIEAGGYLALERVPGGIDVRGPEDGPVPLRAEVGGAGEDQRAPLRLVLAEAVVERRSVKKRINVEKLRAGTDVEISTVGGQVGLRLVGPQRVKALAQDVLADGLPVPPGGLGVGGVDVGACAVVGFAVNWRSVGLVDEPALLSSSA